MMEKSLFEELRSSLTEAVAIAKGDRAPSRTFFVTGRNVQLIRESEDLTQMEQSGENHGRATHN